MRAKTPTEINIMREGGKRLASILKQLASEVEVGKSGKDISALASQYIQQKGLQPILLGYEGFPDLRCVRNGLLKSGPG